MDVDAMELGKKRNFPINPNKEACQKAARLLGLCFYCNKKGHIGKNCPKKGQNGPGHQDREWKKKTFPPKICQTTITDEPKEEPNEKVLLNKENFCDMMMGLDEEDRASIVDSLLDF
jgi:hypothetical protein